MVYHPPSFLSIKITPIQVLEECGIIFLSREDYAVLWICIAFK